MEIVKIISKPPYDSSWLDYHEDMTNKYNSFVILHDGKARHIETYYTNLSLYDALEYAKNEEAAHHIEIRNCNWCVRDWKDTPYELTYVKPLNELYESYAHPYTEKPNHYSYKPAAVYKDGKLLEMYFTQKQENTSYSVSLINKEGDWYYFHTRFPGYSISFYGHEGDVLLKYDDKTTRILYPFDDFRKNFDNRELETLLSKIYNSNLYGDFYEPLHEHFQNNFGVQMDVNYYN